MTIGSWCRSLACAACVLGLTACTAIPLSTMWKMRGMTAERVFESDPHQLRVAIRTDDETKRGPGQPQMRIDIDAPSTKPICYAFALDPIVVDTPGEAKLEPAGKIRRWYAFGLSKKGLDAFERARREVRIKDLERSKFVLNVTMDNVLIPAESATSLPFRIDLVLDRKEGYFTMINEIDITINRDAEDTKRGSATATNAPPPAADPSAKPACIPAG
jgi:hypothetical protein